jgi:hypothetical protein
VKGSVCDGVAAACAGLLGVTVAVGGVVTGGVVTGTCPAVPATVSGADAVTPVGEVTTS